MAGPEVTYTVKEMLAQMDKRADERHDDTQRSIKALDERLSGVVRNRIEPLEQAAQRKQGSNAAMDKMWIVAVALFGMIVSIPSAVHYFI